MNNDALLYSNHDELQRIDADYILTTFSNLLKWKSSENVLDVGSADGGITTEILMPYLPKDFKKLVGVDIAKKMVAFANNNSKNNPKVEFHVLDITCRKLPSEFRHHFDHIFSFYCLNWIPEERHAQAMKNMYDMLKPGGQVFLTIISNTAVYDVYENMARMEKWSRFAANVKDYVSIYHHLNNPQKKLESFLEKAGFVIELCKTEDRYYTYPSVSYYWNWVKSVNPYIQDLQLSEVDSYTEDFLNELRQHKKVDMENGGNGRVHVTYKILIACAWKPLLSKNSKRNDL